MNDSDIEEEEEREERDRRGPNGELPPFPWPAMISLCAGMLAHSVVSCDGFEFVYYKFLILNADNLK